MKYIKFLDHFCHTIEPEFDKILENHSPKSRATYKALFELLQTAPHNEAMAIAFLISAMVKGKTQELVDAMENTSANL